MCCECDIIFRIKYVSQYSNVQCTWIEYAFTTQFSYNLRAKKQQKGVCMHHTHPMECKKENLANNYSPQQRIRFFSYINIAHDPPHLCDYIPLQLPHIIILTRMKTSISSKAL